MNTGLLVFAAVLFILAAYATYGGTILPNATMAQWNSLCLEFANNSGVLLPEEIKAIIMIESSGNPNSQNPNDPSYGLMGVTVPIGKEFSSIQTATDLFDPNINIEAGSGLLAYLKTKYAVRFPLDGVGGWVQMYNLGEPKFMAGERVPNYEEKFSKYIAQYAADFSSGYSGTF